MEAILLITAVVLGLGNFWQMRQNAQLRDRIDALIDEMAKLEYGPV